LLSNIFASEEKLVPLHIKVVLDDGLADGNKTSYGHFQYSVFTAAVL
jgi:hypothetical protein